MFQYLRNFIRETLLSEGYVSIPEEIMDKAEELFHLINKDKSSLKKEIFKKDENGEFIHHAENPLVKYHNFFNIAPVSKSSLSQKTIPIHVGFYISDASAGNMTNDEFLGTDNILGINLKDLENLNLRTFKQLIHHELTHAQDPLLRKMLAKTSYDTRGKIGNLEKAIKMSPDDADKEYSKYYNSTHEFAAHVGDIIYNIKTRTKGDLRKSHAMLNAFRKFLEIHKKANTKRNIVKINNSNTSIGKLSKGAKTKPNQEKIDNSKLIELGVFRDEEEANYFFNDLKERSSYWLKNPKNKKKFIKYIAKALGVEKDNRKTEAL